MRVLVAALETTGHGAEIVANRIWALGRRHLAGRFREFFFAAGIFRPDGLAALADADRIGSAASPVILVPSQPPRNELWKDTALPLFCLSEIAILDGDRLTLDVAYIEDALRDLSTGPAKAATSARSAFRWIPTRVFPRERRGWTTVLRRWMAGGSG